MRPIKLKMIAFGPYNGIETIDFNDLEDRKLFLITGPTGAGKTTIFDAICYALYGVTNGNDRPEKSVKCQSAPIDLQCEVELEFELHGKTYTLNRIPSQEKKKIRGEGTRLISPEATLSIEGKEIPETGAKHVTSYIETLIGLKVEQFRQIMMIPQGEFRKLLMANSDERTGILKNIFSTNLYSTIQHKFKEEKLALEGTIRKAVDKRNNEIERIEVDTLSESNSEMVSLITAVDKNTSLILEKTSDLIEEDKAVKEIKQKELDAEKEKLKDLVSEKEKAKMNNQRIERFNQVVQRVDALKLDSDRINDERAKLMKLEKASTVMPLEIAILNRKKELNDKGEALKKVKNLLLDETEKFKMAEENLKISDSSEVNAQIESLRKEDVLLNSYVENVQGFTESQEEIIRVRQEKERLIASRNNVKEQLAKEKEQQTINDAKINDNSRVKELLLENEGAQGTLSSHIKLLNEFMNSENMYQKLLADRNDSEKNLRRHETIIADKEHVFKTQKKIYHLNQAALLAKELSEEEACPVCGSTEHVKLAELTEDHVTEDELATVEAHLNTAIDKKRAVELEHQTVKVKLESTLETMEAMLLLLLEKQVISEKNESIEDNKEIVERKIVVLNLELGALKESYLKLEEKLEIYNKAIKDQTLLSEGFVKREAELATVDEALIKVDLELAKKSSNNETLIKDIPEDLRSVESLTMKINSIVKTLEKITKEKEASITHHKNISDQMIQLKSRSEEMASDFDGLTHKYKTEKNAFIKAVTDEGFESVDIYQGFKAQVALIKEIQDVIQTHKQAMHTAEQEHEGMLKEIKDFVIKDIREFDTQLEAVQVTEKSISDDLSKIERRVEINEAQIRQITKITEAIKEDEDNYKLLGKIADIINGKNAKNITLERFILKTYLNDILDVSNQRLKVMTNNRYSLKISEILTDGRSSGGLDLEVTDSFTGLPRSVKTLSGGESFKASLSMALGLAEVVQSYAGGIQLDTVFIDEGFGTLDQESLDSAINCLIQLQDTGRLVGIISHVEELKERINTQLIIETNELGSSTRFVVN